jgi:hypothetical protein
MINEDININTEHNITQQNLFFKEILEIVVKDFKEFSNS